MGASQRFEVLVAAAAGAIVQNVVAGTLYEQVGMRPRLIRIWACQDISPAGGPPTANAVVSVIYGTVNAVEDGTPLDKVTTNSTGPKRNEHELCSFMAAPFDKIKIQARNAGTAAFGAGLGARFLIEHQDY